VGSHQQLDPRFILDETLRAAYLGRSRSGHLARDSQQALAGPAIGLERANFGKHRLRDEAIARTVDRLRPLPEAQAGAGRSG